MAEEETAKVGSVRWRVMPVKALLPSQVAMGGDLEVVL